MYEGYPNETGTPVTQIDLRVGILDISILKSLLENALSCMKRCRKKRKERLPCENCETSHYTNCRTYAETIFAIHTVVAKTLGRTGNDFNELLRGQVCITDFKIAANEMLACIEVFDKTRVDESTQEIFLTRLRSLRISMNKIPRNAGL